MRGNQPLSKVEKERWQKVVAKELRGEKVNPAEKRIQAKGDGRFATELSESPVLLREYPIRLNDEEMQKSIMQEESETTERIL